MGAIGRAFDLDKPAEAVPVIGGRRDTGTDAPVESRTRGEAYADLRQDAMSKDQNPAVPPPAARPVRTFEGGTVTFIIDKDEDLGGYVTGTVTVQPPRDTGQPPGRRG